MLLIFALLMQVQVRVTVPTVRFEVAPPVVEVQPGVMVVRDYGEEVFLVDGRYWMHTGDGRWYRANDYRGGWVVVEPRVVPAPIVRMPPGRYKHHRGQAGEIPRRQRRQIGHRIQGEAETRHDAGEGEAEEARKMEMTPAALAPRFCR